MDRYEFLVGFLSIFLALSITKFIEAIAKLWHRHKSGKNKIELFNLYTFSGVLLFLLQIQFWWGIYKHENALGDLNFFGYIVYISPVIIFIMLVESFIPSTLWETNRKEIDLKEFYWNNNRTFFALAAALLSFEILADIVILLAGHNSSTLSLEPMFFRGLGICLLLLLFWKNRCSHYRIHFAVLIILGMLLFLFIGTQGLLLDLPR